MPGLSPYVPNIPLQVAKNLRITDSNGIPITQLLPVGIPVDNPGTGYISLIGATLSTQIDNYNNVTNILNTQSNSITSLQNSVQQLQISGNTIPNINGYCFSGNAQSPITTVAQMVAQSLCNYIDVLGSTSDITEGILAEIPGTLNGLPAYSNASNMSGLTGWISSPATLADTLNNIWIAYNDSRAGINNAIGASIPNCSQVVIDFQPVSISTGFNIYFSGYSFIPSGYTDRGSTITIADTTGGALKASIDIVALSNSSNPLFLSISGSTLSETSPSYSVTVNANTANTALKTSCGKTIIKSTTHGTSPIVGTASITITPGEGGIPPAGLVIYSGLPYTATYIGVTPTDSYSATLLKTATYYITPTSGGATITITSSVSAGTLNFNWIAYK